MPDPNPPSQTDKARTFRLLHDRGTPFVVPNPWDAGSAVVLGRLGFEALATTSAGLAQSLGRLDSTGTLGDNVAHCTLLCAVTSLPVTVDLENGFDDSPEGVAEAIRQIAAAGAVGASIEDYANSGAPMADDIYPLELAVARIEAAVAAARELPFDFTLTARAENLLRGRNDLPGTIERLQAFSRAGADVVYAPGLTTLEQVRQLTAAVDKPVNVLGPMVRGASVADLGAAGAVRISTGSALANAALAPLIRAGRELAGPGTFGWLKDLASPADVGSLLRP